MKPCPVCGSPAEIIRRPFDTRPYDLVSCSAPCFLYDAPELGGCLVSRRMFAVDTWQALTRDVLLDPQVFEQPQVLPEGFKPWTK